MKGDVDNIERLVQQKNTFPARSLVYGEELPARRDEP